MIGTSEVGKAEKPADRYEKWMDNYAKVRRFTNFVLDRLHYKVEVEGQLPKEGPRVLVLPHQNSLDSLSLMRGIDEYIAFVYSTYQIKKAIALKFIPYHIGGIRVKESYVYFQRLFEHFDRDSLVIVFPQGDFEDDCVSTFNSGITKLVQIYEQRRRRKIAIIPVGIEYQYPRGLPKTMPVPVFTFPFPGTMTTIRFGEPKQLDTKNHKELTEIVMREAAALSKLDYVLV